MFFFVRTVRQVEERTDERTQKKKKMADIFCEMSPTEAERVLRFQGGVGGTRKKDEQERQRRAVFGLSEQRLLPWNRDEVRLLAGRAVKGEAAFSGVLCLFLILGGGSERQRREQSGRARERTKKTNPEKEK